MNERMHKDLVTQAFRTTSSKHSDEELVAHSEDGYDGLVNIGLNVGSVIITANLPVVSGISTVLNPFGVS